LLLVLGSIPPILLIPACNWICFGSPLAFGYHNLALPEFQKMNEGLFGITWPPKLDAAYLILFSPQRGLFFWTPFFLIVFFRLRRLSKASRALFWVSGTVVLLQVLLISGYYMPGGGSALGPRHLAPMLAFLAVAAASGISSWRVTGVLMGYCSLVFTAAATLIEGMPSEKQSNLLFEVLPEKLTRGETSHNLLRCLGLEPRTSALLLLAVLLLVYAWAAIFLPNPPARNVNQEKENL
jgi:hypothetical protein